MWPTVAVMVSMNACENFQYEFGILRLLARGEKEMGLVSAEMDEVLEVIVRPYRFFYKVKDEAVWIIAV
ncbi:MAG TPA: hypothetical protein PK575_03210 [Syntrophorhabdus sp.]|jgi:hypothetical protein|nr:hypothetical protein [Syntrophorhabdus sp.]HQI95715.1 hypothetical protein [Syntrophorhabdus sp.]